MMTGDPTDDWESLPMEGWEINLVGVRPFSLHLDIQGDLNAGESASISVTGPIRITDSNGVVVTDVDISRDPTPADFAAAVALAGQLLSKLAVTLGGRLRARTNQGWEVDAGPSPSWENWTVLVPSRRLEFGAAGGGGVWVIANRSRSGKVVTSFDGLRKALARQSRAPGT